MYIPTTQLAQGNVSCGARVHRTTNQTLTTGTDTEISFNAERFDTDAFHDNATNSTRCTVPVGKAGVYVITGAARFAANATGRRRIYLRLNGTDIMVIEGELNHTATYAPDLTTSTICDLEAGDYVELIATQDSGGNLDVVTVTSGAIVISPVLSLHRVGS